MSGWREVELGRGLRVKHGWAFKGEYFRDAGEQIVLTPGNFHDGGGFKPKNGTEKFYDGTYPEQFLLKRGDVVTAMTEQAQGLLGSTATIPKDDTYLHNQRIGLIEITDPEVLDLRYVYHLMNAAVVRRQLYATATGAKVRHTAPERIQSVQVEVPDILTQRVIAELLDGIDDLIENNRRRVAVLEEMARTIYREWFVKFRYPGHEDVPLVDSALGPIPEGWEVQPLAAIAKVNQTSRKPRPDEVFRYLDIAALAEREVGELDAVEGADAPGRARRVIKPGDTVWATVRPNRRAHALVVAPGEDWIASTGLAVLSPTTVSSAFLFEATSTTTFSDWLIGRATGSAYPAVRAVDFEEATVAVPNASIDAAFAEKVAPMHELSWKLRAECSALAGLRDLLLPKLVTGQIDISSLNLDVLMEERVAS
ncbi:restriction endonuclease subunit S [Kocuria sp. CPCC 204721]|uniref:restriction endonuclease subunit S n=1 Tax=Kocuria sp. CPCC 204721 TaxID=3073548 RepID=UPI0034D7344C